VTRPCQLARPPTTASPSPPLAAGGPIRQGNGRRQVAHQTQADRDGEAGIVRRIADGDQRALAEVVRQHGGRLRALALGFAGGAAEADDIVQETFWTLWKRAGSWKPDGPPLVAWLTRVAMNRAIDRERRRKVRGFFGLDDVAEPSDDTVSQEQRMAAHGELKAVMDDVKDLPARQRAAILLAADGERSNREIAEALGLSVGATEQLLVRARRTLRARLAARDE